MIRIISIETDATPYQLNRALANARAELAHLMLSHCDVGALGTINLSIRIQKKRNRRNNPMDTYVIIGNIIA